MKANSLCLAPMFCFFVIVAPLCFSFGCVSPNAPFAQQCNQCTLPELQLVFWLFAIHGAIFFVMDNNAFDFCLFVTLVLHPIHLNFEAKFVCLFILNTAVDLFCQQPPVAYMCHLSWFSCETTAALFQHPCSVSHETAESRNFESWIQMQTTCSCDQKSTRSFTVAFRHLGNCVDRLVPFKCVSFHMVWITCLHENAFSLARRFCCANARIDQPACVASIVRIWKIRTNESDIFVLFCCSNQLCDCCEWCIPANALRCVALWHWIWLPVTVGTRDVVIRVEPAGDRGQRWHWGQGWPQGDTLSPSMLCSLCILKSWRRKTTFWLDALSDIPSDTSCVWSSSVWWLEHSFWQLSDQQTHDSAIEQTKIACGSAMWFTVWTERLMVGVWTQCSTLGLGTHHSENPTSIVQQMPTQSCNARDDYLSEVTLGTQGGAWPNANFEHDPKADEAWRETCGNLPENRVMVWTDCPHAMHGVKHALNCGRRQGSMSLTLSHSWHGMRAERKCTHCHNCEFHGHLHIGFYLGRSHVGSNDSDYKIIKVSVDVHRGEHP